ncbi:MAG TPA: cytochrome P450 [Micromonosporaceae bacterium]|nr:cytochrome P450 [Micromonosporaceae bacterium]HCU50795.1 cytochrome P450 [Micromonosporaceae bacterium]
MRIFAQINGSEGIVLPGNGIDAVGFRQVYSHPAANGRSKGAALSDLFWYWLSPGAHLHQEHLEPGPLYDEVARTTRRILSVPTSTAERVAAECTARTLDELTGTTWVRLRDLMMPIWADFYYELVFGRPCPAQARSLIVGNANDVVTALKCCGLRHMRRRNLLTEYLADQVEAGLVPHKLPEGLSTHERALYLQGVFFNTAVVQTSEAMTHLLIVVARHPEVVERIADDHYLDRLIDETLRLYPLFGIAHRITSADIRVDDKVLIPSGSVVCFDYPAYHRTGFEHPDRFDPDRWCELSTRDSHHIPFGEAANRPCPAWRLSPVTMRSALRETVRRFTLHTSATHIRSIPNRGPCLLVANSATPAPTRLRMLLSLMRLRDRWEDVWRSVVQLVLGTYMVWDARRLRLCQRHFEQTAN